MMQSSEERGTEQSVRLLILVLRFDPGAAWWRPPHGQKLLDSVSWWRRSLHFFPLVSPRIEEHMFYGKYPIGVILFFCTSIRKRWFKGFEFSKPMQMKTQNLRMNLTWGDQSDFISLWVNGHHDACTLTKLCHSQSGMKRRDMEIPLWQFFGSLMTQKSHLSLIRLRLHSNIHTNLFSCNHYLQTHLLFWSQSSWFWRSSGLMGRMRIDEDPAGVCEGALLTSSLSIWVVFSMNYYYFGPPAVCLTVNKHSVSCFVLDVHSLGFMDQNRGKCGSGSNTRLEPQLFSVQQFFLFFFGNVPSFEIDLGGLWLVLQG